MSQLSKEQQERVKQELKRRLTIARGIEIESGSAKDRAFVDGGIAADKLFDLGAPDWKIDGAGCDSGDPLDFTLAEVGQGCGWFIDKAESAATAMRDKCVEKVEDFRRRIQYESDEGIREALFGDMVIELESLTLKRDS